MRFLIVAFLLLVPVLWGQTELERTTESRMFFYDIINSKSPENPDLSRMAIIIEMVYDDLQFIKVKDGFEAQYEVTIAVDKKGNQVTGDLWDETVTVNTFELTNSRRNVSLTNGVFDIKPGKYKVRIFLKDYQREEKFEAEAKVKLQKFADDQISAGGLAFARQINRTLEGNIQSIVPEVTNQYKGLGRNSKVYFEVYNPNNLDSVDIHYEIEGKNTETQIESGFPLALTGEKTGVTFPLNSDTLEHDAYSLTIKVQSDKKDFKLEKPFYIRWQGLPTNVKDLESAIKQARYAADNTEWKKLIKASEKEKLQAFKEFWKKQDPTPNDNYNEAMYNFYARVQEANRNFSEMGRDGWRTDRGMVYIILGPPDNIVSNNYPANSRPYQVWQYYSINRQFEFYDRTGFGNYDMLYPVSIYELQRYAEN